MKYIEAVGCHITDPELIKFSGNVESLDLSNNPILNISSLGYVRTLNILNTNVSVIPSLPLLENLTISQGEDLIINPLPNLRRATVTCLTDVTGNEKIITLTIEPKDHLLGHYSF